MVSYIRTDYMNGSASLMIECPCCGQTSTIKLDPEKAKAFDEGLKAYTEHRALMQNAFPFLTSDERELLISGTCPKCWNDIFRIPESEDSDDN